MIFLLFSIINLYRNKTLLVPCIFSFGLREIHSWVLGFMFFTGGLLCASKYDPNIALKCLLKYRLFTVTIYLGKYFIEIQFHDSIVFDHIITK